MNLPREISLEYAELVDRELADARRRALATLNAPWPLPTQRVKRRRKLAAWEIARCHRLGIEVPKL